MTTLLVIIGCFVFVVIIERIYCSYLDTLPKDKKDKIIKKQSKMSCNVCNANDFEVIGMKHGKLIFQCRNCKTIH